jgi:Fe-S-cluster-containing hydrogenase component 2
MQCELACSFVQTGEFRPSQSVIKVHIFDEQASMAPYTCFQCDEAWCMTVCPVNAITVDPAIGAKVVLEDTCVGCKLCTIACPFGTIFYNADTSKASKCNLCGGDPACAHACPTDAIEFADAGTQDWVGPWAENLNESFLVALAGEPEAK